MNSRCRSSINCLKLDIGDALLKKAIYGLLQLAGLVGPYPYLPAVLHGQRYRPQPRYVVEPPVLDLPDAPSVEEAVPDLPAYFHVIKGVPLADDARAEGDDDDTVGYRDGQAAEQRSDHQEYGRV